MNRISLHTEKRIIELWFKGVTRDTIADKLGVSGSTVSRIISKLPEESRELRSLSVELSKHSLSIPEAKKGAKLHSRLNQLGVSFTQLRDGIDAVEKASKKEDYEPRQVVQATMKLSKLEKEAGKSYTQILQSFKAKTSQIEKLEKREQNLKERTLEKKRDQQQQLRQNRVRAHREMDRPVKYFGRTHRDLFHDIPSAYFIARKHYPNDPNAEWAAYYHIHFNEICSSDPEFKRLLEKLAKQASRKKRKKKSPSKLPHVVDARACSKLWNYGFYNSAYEAPRRWHLRAHFCFCE